MQRLGIARRIQRNAETRAEFRGNAADQACAQPCIEAATQQRFALRIVKAGGVVEGVAPGREDYAAVIGIAGHAHLMVVVHRRGPLRGLLRVVGMEMRVRVLRGRLRDVEEGVLRHEELAEWKSLPE
ncbi:MAG: hypothetical protein PBV54_04385 [Achromobacter xylosoxidans]